MAEDFTINGKITLNSTEAEKTLADIEARLSKLPKKFEALSLSANTGEALNNTIGAITMLQEKIEKLGKLQPNIDLSSVTSSLKKYEDELLKIKTSIHSRITDEAKWAKIALSDIATSSKNTLVTSINDAKKLYAESERLTREAEKNIEQAEKRRVTRDKKRIADAKKHATQSEARLNLEQERREQEQIYAGFTKPSGSDKRVRTSVLNKKPTTYPSKNPKDYAHWEGPLNPKYNVHSFRSHRDTKEVYDYITGQWVVPSYRSGQAFISENRVTGSGKTRKVASYRPPVSGSIYKEILPSDTVLTSSEIKEQLSVLKSKKKVDKQQSIKLLSDFYGGDITDASFLKGLFPTKDFTDNTERQVKSTQKKLRDTMVQTYEKAKQGLVVDYARKNAIASAGGVDYRPKHSAPVQGGYSGAGRIEIYEKDLADTVVDRYIEDDPEKIIQILREKATRIAVYNKLTAADKAILRREGGASREQMSAAFKALPKKAQDALFGPTEITSEWGWVTDENGHKSYERLAKPRTSQVTGYMSAAKIREEQEQLDLAFANAPELYKKAYEGLPITNKDLTAYDIAIKEQNDKSKEQIERYTKHQLALKDIIDTDLIGNITGTMSDISVEGISASDVSKGMDKLNGLVDVFSLLTGFDTSELKENIRRLMVVDPKSLSSYVSSVLKPSFWRTYNAWEDVVLGGNPSALLDRMPEISKTTEIFPGMASSYVKEGKVLSNFEQYIKYKQEGASDVASAVLKTLTASELQQLVSDYPELLTKGPQRPANFLLDAMQKQDQADNETREYIEKKKKDLEAKGSEEGKLKNLTEFTGDAGIYEAANEFLDSTENAIFKQMLSDIEEVRKDVLRNLAAKGMSKKELVKYIETHKMGVPLDQSFVAESISATDSADTLGITDQITASGEAIKALLLDNYGIDEQQLVKLAEKQGFTSVDDFVKELARIALQGGEAVLNATRQAFADKIEQEINAISKTERNEIKKIPGITEAQIQAIQKASGSYADKMNYISGLKVVKGSGEFRTEEPMFTSDQIAAISKAIGTPYDRANYDRKNWWNSPDLHVREQGAYSFASTDFTGTFGIDKGGLELSSRFNKLRDLALAIFAAKEKKDDIAYEQALRDLKNEEKSLYEHGGYHVASRRLLGSMLRADAAGDLDTVLLRKSQLRALSGFLGARSGIIDPITEELGRFYNYVEDKAPTYSLTELNDSEDWLRHFKDKKRVHYHPYLDRDKRQEILAGSTLDFSTLMGLLAWGNQGFDMTQGLLPSAFSSLTGSLLRDSLRANALKEYTPVDVSSLDVSSAGIDTYVTEAQAKVKAFVQSFLSVTRKIDELNVVMKALEINDSAEREELASLINIKGTKERPVTDLLVQRLHSLAGVPFTEDASINDLFSKASADLSSRKFDIVSRLGDFVTSGKYVKGYEYDEETNRYDKPVMASIRELISQSLYDTIIDFVKRVSSGVVSEGEKVRAELIQDNSEDEFIKSNTSRATRIAMVQAQEVSAATRNQLYSMQAEHGKALSLEELKETQEAVERYIVDLGASVRGIKRISNKNLKGMSEEDWATHALSVIPDELAVSPEVVDRINEFYRLYSNRPSSKAPEKEWGKWKTELEANYAEMRKVVIAYYDALKVKRAEDVADEVAASAQKVSAVEEEVAKKEKALSVDWAESPAIDKQRSKIERAYKGNKLTIFDTETTGTDVNTAQLLQLAAQKLNADGTVRDTFNKYITPTGPIPEEATRVNALLARDGALYRIKQDVFEQLKNENFKSLGSEGFNSLGLDQLEKLDTVSLKEALQAFADFIDKTRLVGFNSDRFDSTILSRLFKENDVTSAQYTTGDVLALAQRFDTATGHKTLSDFASLFGIATPNAHDAMGDVQTTTSLLLELFKQYALHDAEVSRPSEPNTPPSGPSNTPNTLPSGGTGPWALESTLKNETNAKLEDIKTAISNSERSFKEIKDAVDKVTADKIAKGTTVDQFGEQTGVGFHRAYDSASALSGVKSVKDLTTDSDLYAQTLSAMSGVDVGGRSISNVDFRGQFVELSEAAGLSVKEANVYVSNGIKVIDAVVAQGAELLQVKVREVGDTVKVTTSEATATIKRKYAEAAEAQTQWADKLKEQEIALKKANVKELESAGNYKEATKLKLALLNEEKKEALALLEEDIAAQRATEEEKTNLIKYYKNERKRIKEEEKAHEGSERDPFSTAGLPKISNLKKDYQELIPAFSRINTDDPRDLTAMEDQARQVAEGMGLKFGEIARDASSTAGQITFIVSKGSQEAKVTVTQTATEIKAKVSDVGKHIKGQSERTLASIQSIAYVLSSVLKGFTFKQLVSAAGAAEKALKSLQATTGKYAKEALAMVDTLNESYGMAKTQAAQALTYAYNQISEVGISNNQALQMSNALVQLGADYSAYYGGAKSAMEVTQALTQVMLGSYRAARQYGIAISSTDIEQLAIAQGKQTNNLSEAEKMLLRYEVVMSRASNVMGEYERTTDTYFHAQQELNKAWTDAKVALGDTFLPIATEALTLLTDLASVIGSGGLVSDLVALIAIVVTAAGAFSKLSRSVESIYKALGKERLLGLTVTKMTSIVGIALTLVSTIVLIASKLSSEAKKQREAARAATEHADELSKLTTETNRYANAIANAQTASERSAAIKGLSESLHKRSSIFIEQVDKRNSVPRSASEISRMSYNEIVTRNEDLKTFNKQVDTTLSNYLSDAQTLLAFYGNIKDTIDAVVSLSGLEEDEYVEYAELLRKYLSDNLSIYDALAINAKAVVDYSSKLETSAKNLVSIKQKELEAQNKLFEAYKIEQSYLDEVYTKEKGEADNAAIAAVRVNFESAASNKRAEIKRAQEITSEDDEAGQEYIDMLEDQLATLEDNSTISDIDIYITSSMNDDKFKGTQADLSSLVTSIQSRYALEKTEAELIVGAYKSAHDREKMYLNDSEKLLREYIAKQDVSLSELKKSEYEAIGGDIYQSMDARRQAYSDLFDLQIEETNTAYANQVALIEKWHKEALEEAGDNAEKQKKVNDEYNAYMDRAERKRLRDSKANFDSYLSNIKNITDEVSETFRNLYKTRYTNAGDFEGVYQLSKVDIEKNYSNTMAALETQLSGSRIASLNAQIDELTTGIVGAKDDTELSEKLTMIDALKKELADVTANQEEYDEAVHIAMTNAYLEYINSMSDAFKEYATSIASATTPLEDYNKAMRNFAEVELDNTSDPTGAMRATRNIRQAHWTASDRREELRGATASFLTGMKAKAGNTDYFGNIAFDNAAAMISRGEFASITPTMIESMASGLEGTAKTDFIKQMNSVIKDAAKQSEAIAAAEFADVGRAISGGLLDGLQAFDELFSTFEQNEQNHIQNQINKLQDAYNDMKEQMEKRNDQSYDNLTRSQKDAIERQKKMDEDELERMKSQIEDEEALLEEARRKAFEREKGFKLAEATISGIQASLDAYVSGTEIGGPAVGAIFATMATAFTAAKIAAIAAQEYQASYAQGAYDLPQDQTGVNVHKGEMIIPRPFAETLRSEISGNTSDASSGDIVINVYGATDEVSVESSESDNQKQLDIYLTKRVKTMVARGELDGALQTRYAISKNGRRA